jgi:hypothetical protein
MAIGLECFARHLAPHAEATNEIKSVSAGLKIWRRHRPLRPAPISPQEAYARQRLCGRASALERAADPLYRARIDAEPLRYLAHAVGAPTRPRPLI